MKGRVLYACVEFQADRFMVSRKTALKFRRILLKHTESSVQSPITLPIFPISPQSFQDYTFENLWECIKEKSIFSNQTTWKCRAKVVSCREWSDTIVSANYGLPVSLEPMEVCNFFHRDRTSVFVPLILYPHQCSNMTSNMILLLSVNSRIKYFKPFQYRKCNFVFSKMSLFGFTLT